MVLLDDSLVGFERNTPHFEQLLCTYHQRLCSTTDTKHGSLRGSSVPIYFRFVFHFRFSFLFAWCLFYLRGFFLFAFSFFDCLVSFLFAWFIFYLCGFFFVCVISFFICVVSFLFACFLFCLQRDPYRPS